MDREFLDPAEERRLARLDLTYSEVGATQSDVLPPGYHHLHRQARIGSGGPCFARAVDQLMGWELQRRSGVRVLASTPRVRRGSTAVLLLGPGRLAVKAPVRVVALVDEPGRQGFVYGTLPGHPETGEESFVVEHDAQDAVIVRVTAFSRPGTPLTKVAGPVGRMVQKVVTERYLRALRS